MDVIRGRAAGSRTEQRGTTFTGVVWAEPMLGGGEVTIATVNFSPGARTYWHAHGAGQTLHVTAGEGLVAQRGGPPQRIRTGDIVWTPPGEEHWHGAGDDAFLVHVAVSHGDTTWLEEVTDEEYRSTPR